MFALGIVLACISIISLLFTYFYFKNHSKNKSTKTPGFRIICGCLIILLIGGAFLTYKGAQAEDFKRWAKNVQSNYSGGLERKITIINQDGEILKTYEGKMDIEETDGDKIVFIIEGKKHIIYNSIFNTILVEEK